MFLTRVSKKQQRRNGAGKFATMKINIRGLSVKDECPHHVTIFSHHVIRSLGDSARRRGF